MERAPDPITKREREVLAHLAEGERVATVAKALSVSPYTVRNHLSRIFWKLGVHSQSELLEHVKENPEVLGEAAPLSTPRTQENLVHEYELADRQLTERIAKAFLKPPGTERLRAILREALPLDAERANEWRARLDLWCLASDSSELGAIHREHMDGRLALMEERISSAQREGWVQAELDAPDLAQMLMSLVLSATIQILQFPSSQDTQLRILDAYVESVTTD